MAKDNPPPLQRVQRASHLLCFSLLGLSVACGSGSSEDAKTKDGADNNTPLSGVVSIEQRFGKTMLDAWFAPNTQLALPKSSETLLAAGEQCLLKTVSRDHVGANSVQDNIEQAFDSSHSVRIGPSISFDSRGGAQATLDAMALGQSVVYSTIDRWLDEPLAEDTQLVFNNAIERWPISDVSVLPLLPLVLSTPTQGLLPDVAQRIEWESGGELAHTNTIHIRLSVLHNDGGVDNRTDISCITSDDGSFTLPSSLQEQLTANARNAQAMLFLVRKRLTLHSSGDALLALSQTSYANP